MTRLIEAAATSSRRAVLAAACGLLLLHAAAADTFTMRDGSVLTGELKGLTDGIYSVRTDYGLVKLPASSVLSISKQHAAAAVPQAATGAIALRFAGSTTIGDELMPALIEGYAVTNGEAHPHWTIEGSAAEQTFQAEGAAGTMTAHLSRHGSATAFSALADGSADVGMASRPIKPDEKATLATSGFGDASAPGQEHVLALDGLVVLVNRANTLQHLSLAQLAAIFAGRTTNWQDVGGAAGPIHLLGRDAKSGTADTFAGLVLKGEQVAAATQLMDSSDAVSDQVASDPAAIGFAGFAYVRRAKALSIVPDCGMETAPDDFFVRTEE